jgi:sorting nexin-8
VVGLCLSVDVQMGSGPPSSSPQDFLPADIQSQFSVSRELIRNVYHSFYKLRDRAERIATRAIDNAADLLMFGKELRQAPGAPRRPRPATPTREG